MIPLRYDPGVKIFKQGEQATTFYIIKEGLVSVNVNNNFIRNLYPGDTFGQQALYEDGFRKASIVTVQAT